MRLAQFLFVFLFLVFSTISLAQGNANIVPVLSLLLEENPDSPSEFNNIRFEDAPGGEKKVFIDFVDADGIEEVSILPGTGTYSNLGGVLNYTNTNSSGYPTGTEIVATIVDSKGNVKTKDIVIP